MRERHAIHAHGASAIDGDDEQDSFGVENGCASPGHATSGNTAITPTATRRAHVIITITARILLTHSIGITGAIRSFVVSC